MITWTLYSPTAGKPFPFYSGRYNIGENWKFKYYLAQNYLAVGQIEKGKSILKTWMRNPIRTFSTGLGQKCQGTGIGKVHAKDFQKALELKPRDWKVWEENIQFHLKNANYGEAFGLSKKAYKKFPKNYNIGLAHAIALLNTGRFENVLSLLENIQVLPYEHASESRDIYERAHLAIAQSYLEKKKYHKAIQVLKKSKKWPENIGVGNPIIPMKGLQDYLLALSLKEIGETENSKALLDEIIAYTENHLNDNSLNHLYGLLALKKMGKDGESDPLMTRLEKTAGDKNQKSLLALALYENKAEEVKTLELEQRVPKDVLELAAWAVQQ